LLGHERVLENVVGVLEKSWILGKHESGNPLGLWHTQCTSALSSGFPISQGNAEALDRRGGKTKHHMIPYFLSNISAKNYHNRIVYVKFIRSRTWDVFFETRCIYWGLPVWL